MKPVSPSAASRAAAMEDEERRRKLEAGRAKLAEYRQRKAQSDGQKKQKKKKQKGSEPEDSGVQQEGAGERKETPTTEFSFSRTLRSGETVKHDQTYTIEPESEVSTTAEDCSSEDEELHPPVSPLEEELQQAEPPSRLQAMEDELAAKNLTVEELSRELEEIRAAFGAEGVQQLQDFEAALKQRDGIITQLTANLQQARTEKDEVMREFLELTEQSQKLQLQFQQLQVGESLRSSSISSTAADLIQARQQVLFFQQQLEVRGVKVKDLQVQLEERDIEVIGLQEKLLQMTQRLSQIETVSREAEESFTRRLQEKDLRVAEQEKLLAELQDGVRASEQRLQQVAWEAEESFAQRLQEKDLQRVEQERLIAEQQQLLAQLQDNLQASKNHLNEVSEQLAMKVRELEACELDLQTSRQKERLSSGEIQQLMGTVEDLQKRYHHQGAEQGDTARKMDYLRAELDEMYGQQIVQMKQELSARHAEELARIRDQHSAEVDKISEHLRAKWTQSAGEVNALNARVVELQQKLQENQVLREKAEQDLAQVSENKLLLQNQVQELVENLRLAKQCNEMERSQTVQQELQAAISDLQAKLVAAHEASSELEAKHESEITNYQIKLEMLEREKDAVLDRMAESQEAELERLRTQLLFSHEEELFRLREDLQHESQMNMENLRDELRQVRNGYEAEKVVLDAERVSLLQEIVVLKHDLSQALENSRVDELVSQLKELQEEVQELRKRDSEKSEPEVEETWKDNLESENKLLKEKETAMVEELKSLKEDHEVLLKKMGTLATDNEKANKLVEELRAEIEKQKTTFSFAEKNFEINCQELREELEERLRELTLQYETKLQKLQTKLQTPEQGHEKGWTEEREEKETDGAALVEKDVTELMEKLQRVELEKAGLEEKVEQKQTELQKMEGELQWVELEKVELLEQKEAHLRRIEVEKVELVEQFKQKEEELCALRDEVRETALKNNGLERELEALKWMQLEDGGVCSIKDHHLQLTALEEELQALRTLRSVEQDRLAVLQQEEQALLEQREEEEVEAVPVEGLLAPPLALTGRESQSTVFTKQRTHSRNGGSGGVVVTETQQKQVKIRDVLSDGETGVQAVTRPLSMEGSDHEECRLQMEALRISLSQIHAAQLELLKESLNTQTTVPKDDPRCRSFNEGQSEDYKRLAQMAREDQTVRSDGVPSSGPAGPPLGQLNEEAIDCSSGWEVDRRLRLEFHEQQELQEQQHRQEIQRLRSYYSQQAEETEERYRNEINLLQSRLQELTGAEAIYSVPGDSPHLHQRADLLQDAQLDELDSSRTERDERPGDPEDLQRQREEDIAKVIVQMSVEFAQQTELARISRQAGDGEREKLEEELLQLRNQLEMLEAHHSTCTQGAEQTDREEEKESGGEEIRRPSMQSSGTQTEARSGEEDEEGERMRKKEDVMSQLSSQDTESSPDFITSERNLLRKANEKLRQVLVDVLKTTAATEETIGRHVETLLEASSRGQQPVHREASSESFHGSETVLDDASVFSAETETDEGLEMSQMLLGAGLHLERVDLQSDGAEPQMEREEYLSSISSRLQSAVEKLLFTITETTSQLEHARVTQTELMREKFRHSEEIAELLRRQEELQERLQEEASARQRLALQLHNAEGLIDGYSGERRALEEQVRERAELQLQLEQELQVTSSRLHELEDERQNLHHQRELLHRQQEAMRGGAGGRELRLVEAAGDAAPEADLLEETEKLMQEKVEVQRQAEKEHAELLQQVKQLEAELEEQVGHFAELEDAHRAESADLTQQIHALEKQLENNRRFLDEQAVDREHERDVFQQEIQKLEQQLKNPPKPLPSSDQHHREVEELSSALREKADWCSELLLRSEQLQREVEERDEEIEKLESRVRALEQALTANADTLSTAEESKQYASMAAGDDATLEALLQTEREALDRKEKEIVNLEEQLEQFREELQNKSEEVQQLHMQLEIQRKEINTQQQELLAQTDLHAVLEQKDREIALLNEHIAKVQLAETSPDNKEVEEKSELVLELEAQVEYLRGEQERLKRDGEEEVEQLNSVIEKLQQELSHIEHKQSPAESVPEEEEYDELKQKMDQVVRELDTLKTDHSSLLGKYESLRQEALERELETEKQGERLEDALRERTAALVVAQAQVQALEESAGSRVSDLTQRIAELEESVEEKELELHACRLQVGRAQDDAESLHLKVSQLEDKLREKVAAMLVSQAQLEAVQVQTKELHRDEAVLDDAIAGLVHSRAGAELWPSPGLAVAPVQKVERVGKVGFLTEKLQELELGLSFMQKDQELQKELLSSSEEEVQEYERRLAVLMELLNQMRTRPPHTPAQAMGDDSAAMEELLQELQEVKGEAAATKEELDSCRVLSQKLQEQIELKEAAIEELEKDLQKASEQGSEEDSSKVSELLQELQEVKGEAAATKEELSSCKDISQKLQEQIQEREMTIALLKDQLHRASGEVDNSEILQELQEVRSEAAATKEELNSYIERSLKLQEQIQVRDVSIAQLMDELQQLRTALSKASEDAPAQQPQSHSRKKAGKHSEGKGKGSSVAKDKPSLSRKNSNSQPEKSANGSQASCQTRVDAGTQVEQVEVSEELEEVIGEYRERIGQMQELHAAEIMDMENRHISESDSLKRENQRLEQECSALRAAVANLRSGEAARQDLPASSQFRDGYASDSSSDWSQRTGFELPHLQAEFRSTPEGARRDDSEVLPDRIKTLLREVHQEGMQVLSLSEIPVPEAEHPAAQLPLQAWRKEKEALLDTVESLKTLVTQLQTHSQTQTDTESAGDWRADLLSAVQQVFLREREVLKVTLLTQLDLLDTRDAVIHLNQLERALTDQDAVQREVLSSLQSADRRSLLAEISDLRTRLQHLQQDAHLSQQPRPVDSSGMSEDWPEAGGEVEGGGSDGRREGGSDGGGGGEREDRLPAAVEDLKGELAQTKLELEVSLQTQSKYLKELETLRAEVCGKASELDSLSDRLAEEQKRVRELQWAMEREKNRATRREEGEREELEDLRLALEDQQARVADLSVSLEEERKVSTQLREERDGEISEHISLNTELQVQLEAQRLQAVELSSSLQKEKELNAQLLRQLQRSNPDTQRPPQAVSAQGVELAEASCSQVEEGVRSVEVLLQSLQDQLTEKQSALVDLMGQLEQQKLQEVQAKRAWEQDRAELTRDLQGARESLAKLERQAEELKAQLDGERERGLRLERERDGLQQRVTELMERSQRDSQQQTPWRAEGQPVDRTRDWVLQQKEEEARTLTSSSTTMLDAAGQTADSRNLDSVITRLQLIASKINGMTSNTAGRLPAEGPDRESLAWLHSNVQDVLSLLQQVPPVPPPVPESAALLTGGSSSALTERLLRQNAELTGFVSRLTEEKNELRNQLLSLEEELRRQRHLSAHSSSRSGSEGQELVLFSSEREAWSREKMRLEKSLRQAEAELSRLRGEIRSNTLRDVAAPDTDNSALKRIYGKYLRAESFRKALIYQKKYLLLLLGGFQECEEATLSLIARMGGRPTYSHLESLGQHRRGFTRFRSAVRVSIALSRMRFLVRRWKKATGGSLSTPSINRNGLGQFPGIEGRNDSPYLQPSVEQYGERRGTNRTGRESPRTGHYSHHRYGAVGGDGGSVLCSHLQNYDPDRALTDYISRLEALQRRLGSVQSGSSSYAQLHFGVRR